MVREIGLGSTFWYVIARLFNRSGRFFWLERFHLVAQPVAAEPSLPGRRGQSVTVREVTAGDPVFGSLPISKETQAFRFEQGAVCLAAFREGSPIGCLWLCLGPYSEDVVRCRLSPEPSGLTAWDFDVYIAPEHRAGFAFARLWDTANAFLRAHGVAWTCSRISAFNPGSRRSHGSLGARIVSREVVAGGKTYTQVHDGVSGYLSHSVVPLYFGLGEAESVEIS